MALLASKQHTAGNSTLWTVRYWKWLADNAAIDPIKTKVVSSSLTCTIGTITVLGPDVQFLLVGGVLNERVNVSLTMTDNVGNIKQDTIAFTVVSA
jgi:hypothetical protein